MNKIYDNGELLLGQVDQVIDYLGLMYYEEGIDVNDLINDLRELDKNGIVCVNYDNGMGCTFDYWSSDDVMSEVK